MSAIQKRYKLFKRSELKTGKDYFKAAKIHLQKIIQKKKYYFEELAKNRNKTREALDKEYIFIKLCFKSAGDLQEKLPQAPTKFTSQKSKNYYAKT